MLERRDDPRFVAIAKPCEHALALLRQVKDRTSAPKVAEVGIGIGATSVELCRILDGDGEISFFDFAEKVDDLAADLTAHGFENFRTYGNTRRTFDSYCWALAKVLQDMRRAGEDGVFDFIYLDGCHMFHHDAPATVICKELVKPDGILLMDDYNWSIAISPTTRPSANPRITRHFTDEQIEVPHVALICELFLDHDPAFERLDIGYAETPHEHRRAFRKKPGA
ncbi:class I SAM-dependent methyltransferase [Microbaculum marinum]|uniref:Class I SAM-dependent methyltransferase n=1 Tax=Microbaculum marinum TaxID=1764581 RepID=A0AAW9RU58_9HYPH